MQYTIWSNMLCNNICGAQVLRPNVSEVETRESLELIRSEAARVSES
jgi:hypothetical protein